jgi:hypothetical protein
MNRIFLNVRSENGAETVEIIIGIVVFVIFGLTVFGLVTNTAGKRTAQISNCISDTGHILSWHAQNDHGNATTITTCDKRGKAEEPPKATYNE